MLTIHKRIMEKCCGKMEETYEKMFEMGKEYLLKFVDENLLNKHLYLGEKEKPKTINSLFRGLIESLSNRRNMPQTIGDIEKLKRVLYDFSPYQVRKEYGDDWEKLFHRVKKECNPKGQMILENKRSYWVIFCRGAVSAAEFLSRFSSFNEFDEFVTHFYFNEYTRAALPMLIGKEIRGIGFALTCDFLKENGYTDFVKPDVHIKTIFIGLGICKPKSDDYQVFKEVVRFSRIIGKNPMLSTNYFGSLVADTSI
jgi:hypothetical protein